MAVKHYFKEWIEFRNLTQRRVAERMAEFLDSTYDEGTLSKLINNKLKKGWGQHHLEALAFALDCDPDDLLHLPPTNDELALARKLRTLKPDQRKRALRVLEAISDDETAA